MTDPSSPYPEVPTEALENALAAATAALRGHATEPYGDVALGPARAAIIVLNVAAPILIAAGRAQAAADIRAHADHFESVGFPLSPLVLDRAAEIAAGGAEGDPSKEQV